MGQVDRLGSLEKGKEADFTILESDPYKVSPDAIADR
jgi:predicted amidohydrolase YtcJ